MAMILSNKQQEIVDYNKGSLAVIASAGSGKTRVLTERIKKTLDGLTDGQKVLAITFSNKAAEELKERLEKDLGWEKVENSIYVGTTHSFCLDLITTRGSYIGLPNDLHIFESESDRLKIFLDAINNIDYWRNKLSPYDRNSSTIKDLYYSLSKRKRELKFYSDYENKPNNKMLFKEYDDLLLSNNAIDFDDILRYAYLILVEHPRIRRIYNRVYKHICVDEAQDLNRAQYEIIKTLSNEGETPVTMVGDPKQAIYGFNGSDSKFFTEKFPKEFISTEVKELDENFRSSQKVLEYAQKLDSNYNITGNLPFQGEFKIKQFENEDAEASWIISKIEYLFNNGHKDVENDIIKPEDICIIARNRYLFNTLIEKLKEKNLAYTMKVSLNNVFSSETDFFKIFELILRISANPKDKIHLQELIDLTLTDDFDIASFDPDINPLDKIWEKSQNEDIIFFQKIRADINNGIDRDIQFNEILNNIESHVKSQENALGNEEAESQKIEMLLIQEELQIWRNLWDKYVKTTSIGNRTLGAFLRAISLGQANDEQHIDGITLSTVHMSKGLEYNVVFIIGVNEGAFPDYRANTKDALEEEKHNMFVAITRSKRLCYVTYPKTKSTRDGNVREVQKSLFIDLLEA